jgi:hypothetical protein
MAIKKTAVGATIRRRALRANDTIGLEFAYAGSASIRHSQSYITLISGLASLGAETSRLNAKRR